MRNLADEERSSVLNRLRLEEVVLHEMDASLNILESLFLNLALGEHLLGYVLGFYTFRSSPPYVIT